ncbi:putative AbiEi antitoxin of type IV toxin-antitoxin system [Mobilisporobacter senegalensis]|uniref:Putative AbiEi antitoxin of type IV toxin-antitoxin system n=1 Tax=Mobilisporobacter senegalensis TaxID=1329262 RepID=A0A3N1XW54_9FIRM|nr:type IV toxin-antitoxin system AbiEi family antitoxin domain-containing protein [Mobilisporobacter senegalensis]ROR29167.1 putative AbiEi antitoxin of type IV toxin-antitoxin system [Mobilisporobacter senegalensis]
MDYENIIIELLQNHNGIVRTKDIEGAGIPRQYIPNFIQEGILTRKAQGVYLAPDTFIDQMYCIGIRSPQIVFSNETALYIHKLTDIEPPIYSVTVPRGYATNRLRKSGIDVSTVKQELYPIGIINGKTKYGRDIQVYDSERTICDIIKNRNKMDKDMFYIALKKYAVSKDRNLKLLFEYSKQLGMSNQVLQYLEGFLV